MKNGNKYITPVKSRGGGVFSLANMRIGLLYVFLVAAHENQGLFRDIYCPNLDTESAKIAKTPLLEIVFANLRVKY